MTRAPERALLEAASRDDGEAFGRLVAPYRAELHAHCYRMLGSVQDAEDALQEALLGAWRGLAGFEGRSPLRAWLYRITTNACLRLLERRPRRLLSADYGPAFDQVDDLGEPVAEPVWLEPYPTPEGRYELRESVELAFVAAWERADVAALLELLASEARFTMPPLPAWFEGRERIGRFLAERMFATPWRLVPIRANGQLAFACYQGHPATGRFRLGAVNVLGLRDGRVVEINGFVDPGLHRHFGLPEER